MIESRLARSTVFGVMIAFFSSSAIAQAACTNDTLVIDGSILRVSLCPEEATGATARLGASEQFSLGSRTFSRTATLRLPVHGHAAHAVDDVYLEPLGIAKTLHLTLGINDGSLVIEHALLLPGPTIIR